MITKNVYKVSGFGEYKVAADNIKEAADLYYEIVGKAYVIKEIVYLFTIYINDNKKKMD